MRAKRAVLALALATAFLLAAAPPAMAVEEPAGVVNGKALAVAAQNVLYVNPNFDVYPVYSFSRNDNLSSYDLSGGTWPGFLLDAFMDFYGFGKVERSALGIVETQFPGVPSTGQAATSDYGRDNVNNACAFLFGPQGPSPSAEVLAACKAYVQTMIDDKSSKQLAARGASDFLHSNGTATLNHAVLAPGVVADHVESRTSTDARTGVQRAEAHQIITGLEIGPLRIGALRATARASAAKTGKNAESLLTLAEVTFMGEPAEIDDQGVHVLLDSGTKPVNDQLAAYGFDVRLTQGRTYDEGPARVGESGGLVVRMRRDSLPDELVSAQDTLCATFAGPPFSDVPELARLKRDEPNPLYGVVPFVPMPPTVSVDEPIPPVVPCVYPNLAYDVGVLIGTAQAAAQFTPLPPPPPVTGGGDSGPTQREIFETVTIPGETVVAPDLDPAPVATVGPYVVRRSVPVLTAAVAGRIKLVYAMLFVLLIGLVGGRFALRALAAP